MRKPKFVEPNLDVVQVSSEVGAASPVWQDYASIKTPADMVTAIRLVDSDSRYRIIRKQMGTRLIYA